MEETTNAANVALQSVRVEEEAGNGISITGRGNESAALQGKDLSISLSSSGF